MSPRSIAACVLLLLCLTRMTIVSAAEIDNLYTGCTADNAHDVCTVGGLCSSQGKCICSHGWSTYDTHKTPHCSHRLRYQESAYNLWASIGGPFGAVDAYLGYKQQAWLKAAVGFFSVIAAVLVAIVWYAARAAKALFSCATERENAAQAELFSPPPSSSSTTTSTSTTTLPAVVGGDGKHAASEEDGKMTTSAGVAVAIETRSPVAVLKADALIPERCMSSASRRIMVRISYGIYVFSLALLGGLFIVWIASGFRIVMGYDLVDADNFPVVLWGADA